ncbi:MAG: hypothetical protein GC154_13265 [bacterium]|nr:hypothetical protein [bacterium]
MNDDRIHIPPAQVGGIGPQPAQPSSKGPSPIDGAFQEKLVEAMGKVSSEVEKIQKASPANVEELDSLMDAAKSLYSDTMQAHQLMQSLMSQLGEINAKMTPPDSDTGES